MDKKEFLKSIIESLTESFIAACMNDKQDEMQGIRRAISKLIGDSDKYANTECVFHELNRAQSALDEIKQKIKSVKFYLLQGLEKEI